MIKRNLLLPLVCVSLPILLALCFGCDSDELPEPTLDICDSLMLNTLTYDNEIRPIIATKCTNDGCHGAGSSDGDYTDFQGMLLDLDNGRIHDEVLLDRTMPQTGSEDLTDEERNMIQCWLGNGYPES